MFLLKNVLVAGGAGFIGSHLCDFLVEKGNRVFCIDNFSTGSEKNVAHLIGNKNFVLVEHDVCKPIVLNVGIAEVFNLASPASPKDFREMALEIMQVNSIGTKNLLEFALKNRAKFFQASTSEVYGNPLEHPQKESYFGNVNPIGERSVYDEGKRFSEASVMAYKRKFDLNVKICRIFNTYGDRMRPDDGRIIPNFINQALNNRPITVYGNGKRTRSFCHVLDLIDGFQKLMDSNISGPVNLGNPLEFSVLDVAKKIKQLAKSDSEIVFKDLDFADDPEKRKPDISMAQAELNWFPKISFEDGLLKTIEYFRKS